MHHPQSNLCGRLGRGILRAIVVAASFYTPGKLRSEGRREPYGPTPFGGYRLMIELYNNATNQLIGALTEAELQTLIDALEEESQEDQDYYIDAATIDILADGRTTDHLIQLLRTALGGAEGVEIRWQRR